MNNRVHLRLVVSLTTRVARMVFVFDLDCISGQSHNPGRTRVQEGRLILQLLWTFQLSLEHVMLAVSPVLQCYNSASIKQENED